MDKQEIVKHEERRDLLDFSPDEVKKKLEKIHQFQAIVRNSLQKDHDFGVIPGTEKPTLLKPGAEKIAKLMNLHDDYDILGQIEDWAKPFFHYTIKCRLVEISSGLLISAGLGSCNSMESKYRFRWVPEWKLTEEQKQIKDTVPVEERPYRSKAGKFKSYRFENDDIFTQVNTLLKMAKKRALVDAALSAGRLSDLFTQDLEDISFEAKPEVEDIPSGNETSSPEKPQEKKSVPLITLTLWDGRKAHLTYATAIEQFEKAKEAVGKDNYYELLGSLGFEHANQIPPDKMPSVFATLITLWKQLQEARKKK